MTEANAILKPQTQKHYNKFVLTKKTPSRFSVRVEPVICEVSD